MNRQQNLLRTIKRQIMNEVYPRFSVICGASEIDKLDIVHEISQTLGCDYVIYHSPKVDDVREAIQQAYTQRATVLYVLLNCDNISAQAKNALLKVTEEPPNSTYIVLGIKNENNLPNTLKSRASIYQMDKYTSEELFDYCSAKYGSADEEVKMMIESICETPDEVDLLLQYNVSDFKDFVELTADNIAIVNGANSFKVSDKLKLKENDLEKYDLALFLKCFMVVCVERYKETNDQRFFQMVKMTSKTAQDLQNVSLNKQMLVDDWILSVRKAWREWTSEN